MSDTQIFFAVLLAVYLLECVAAVRRDALVFAHPAAGLLRGRGVADRVGTRRRALALASPLPPLGTFVVASPWPFSLAAAGATTWRVAAPNPGSRTDAALATVRFDAVRRFSAAGRRILADGAPFCDTDTVREARQLAALLERVRAADPARRAAIVRLEIERSLDEREAAARFDRFRSASTPVRWAASLLVVHLFGVAPGVAAWKGLAWGWPMLLGGAVVLTGAAVALWSAAHRKVRADRPAASDLVALALTPPAAARALDLLARDLFSGLHPAVVARVACPPREGARWIALALRDARSPLSGEPPDPEAAGFASAHHEAWRDALEAATRRWGLDPDALAGRPERDGAGVVAYCPRCGSTFTSAEGGCSDCAGLPRRRF
jgi:hypothetical protein